MAADQWGGSADLTSDYVVRGISRTNHDAALQLDVHYTNSNGFIAGAFASNSQINPQEPRDLELSAYAGFTWRRDEDWRGRILYSHYAYPWNKVGREYDYDELDAEMAYQGWLQLNLNYSPNAPRYLGWRYGGLKGVAEESVELNLQRPLIRHLSILGGVGYSNLGGPDGGGYVYWSAGAAYQWGPVSLSLLFVDTSSEAKALFYNGATARRLLGAAMWHF